MKIFYAILLFLILTSSGAGFGRKRSFNCRKENEQILSKPIHYNPLTDQNATTVHHYNCDATEFSVVQKIPYLRACSACDTIEINFSSACVRCGICLAIAEKKILLVMQHVNHNNILLRKENKEMEHKLDEDRLRKKVINDTLLDIHDIMSPSTCLNNTEIELLLRTICDHSFQYYALREVDGKRFISDRLPGSILVTTSADGLWSKKLRDSCHYYLDEIGELQLYEQWQQSCKDEENFPNLSNVLCRSAVNTLRDCKSMEDTYKYESWYKTYNGKIKITATYGKYGKHGY